MLALIGYFNKMLIPQSLKNIKNISMNNLIEKFKNVKSECCITICLNTNRTAPDNKKDPIVLKNQVKIAEERVRLEFDKKFADDIVNRLNVLADSIDHSKNDHSLLLFVNETVAEFIRLPIRVETRVIVDKTFATRDLLRASHEEINYYILVNSKNGSRLIKAKNDRAVEEIGGDFPISNDTLYNTDSHKRSIGQSNDNMAEEFFNNVDKAVQKVYNVEPLPVVLISEERNYQYFIKVADRKDIYVTHVNKLRDNDNDKPQHLVTDVWETVLQYQKEKNSYRIEELKIAVSEGKFLSDINDIYKAILEGKGQTLFVQKGYFQPGKIENGQIQIKEDVSKHDIGVADDVVDELIEKNLKFGGDVVFIENEDLSDFQNLALVSRY